MSQCIGINRAGLRCEKVSPTDPPYAAHPTWPFLCSDCANEPSRNSRRNSRGIVEEVRK